MQLLKSAGRQCMLKKKPTSGGGGEIAVSMGGKPWEHCLLYRLARRR